MTSFLFLFKLGNISLLNISFLNSSPERCLVTIFHLWKYGLCAMFLNAIDLATFLFILIKAELKDIPCGIFKFIISVTLHKCLNGALAKALCNCSVPTIIGNLFVLSSGVFFHLVKALIMSPLSDFLRTDLTRVFLIFFL